MRKAISVPSIRYSRQCKRIASLNEADGESAVRGGEDAAGLSPTNITRLTACWEKEYTAFRQRDLARASAARMTRGVGGFIDEM
jgi:hypothetical protein